jgi:hypothetical protein
MRKFYRTHLVPTLIAVGAFMVCPVIGVCLNVYAGR